MASYYSTPRDAYARSPPPAPYHPPAPPPRASPASPSGLAETKPLRYLPPSQAHRQNTAPPATGYGSYTGHGAYTADGQGDGPHMRAAGDEPSCIKCSSCAVWVPLDQLGEHVCAAPRLERGERRAPPEGLRIELRPEGGGAGWAGAGQQGTRSPMYPGQHLHTSPPGSAPLTPASLTPPASAGGRLPFFDRYQKFVDTAGTAADNMAGVGSARSPRLPPHRAPTSPLPLSTSASAPNLSVPTQAPYYPHTQQRQRAAEGSPAPPISPGPGYHRQPSPVSSRSATSDSYASSSAVPPSRSYASQHRRQDTPESSVVQSSSSRSGKESVPCASMVHAIQGAVRAPSHASSASSYLPYDRGSEPSFPQSRSTPANLASYANGEGPSAGGGLDACLEDLRLMADGEDMAANEMLDGFFDGRRMTDGSAAAAAAARLPQEGFTADDLLATPRQSPKREKKDEVQPEPRTAPSSSLQPAPPSSSTSLACSACRTPLPASSAPKRTSDGPPFCRPCYADRFLPKCRKCLLPIEGGAVTSSDGKITGKYHPRCFRCFACEADFPGGDFYVFDGKPYCQHDYHALNGSLCADTRCGKPIEGPCVSLVGEENGGGGRYHPSCFNCSEPSCRVPLLLHHFVVERLPYCDVHAAGPVRRRPQRDGAGAAREGAEARAKKRQTIITRS